MMMGGFFRVECKVLDSMFSSRKDQHSMRREFVVWIPPCSFGQSWSQQGGRATLRAKSLILAEIVSAKI